jgi:oxygen-independent coproporphyrinogen-3 oxidase
VRWWNVKHPSAYAEALAAGQSVAAGFERIGPRERHTEDVLLGIRLRSGLPVTVLSGTERQRAYTAVAAGLLVEVGDRLVLTDRGRLLADAVVRDLLDD